MNWIILTGEYPPTSGGVADYTKLVAERFAACGDSVHVYAPPSAAPADFSSESTVHLHRLSDHFGKNGLAELQAKLAELPKPRRILVQYVAHAFGSRAMNVRFCLWLRRLGREGESIDVMFHEVAYPLEAGQPLRHRLLARVTRWMARSVGKSAQRIFISIPAWEKLLNDLGVDAPMIWSPIPSTVGQSPDAAAVAAIRARFGDAPLIGHFGTYGKRIAPGVSETITLLSQRDPSRKFLMLGRGGEEFIRQMALDVPALEGRMYAPGILDAEVLSEHLAACDLMVQPYPDGVSSRRTSVMASLALGIPIVTSVGPLTESLWAGADAVALATTSDAEQVAAIAEVILNDPEKRAALGRRALALYREQFDVTHAIEALRS